MMKKMTAVLSAAALLTLLGGCGYKAPPYYEKDSKAEGSSVAL